MAFERILDFVAILGFCMCTNLFKLSTIKNNINFIIREDLSIFIEKSFETLFLEVTSSNGSIIIGEVYRVPNSSCPD